MQSILNSLKITKTEFEMEMQNKRNEKEKVLKKKDTKLEIIEYFQECMSKNNS